MSDSPKYDITTYLHDHAMAYMVGIKGNNFRKEEIKFVLVTKFGETLTKWVLTWYSHLSKYSISLFAELVDVFIKAHFGA